MTKKLIPLSSIHFCLGQRNSYRYGCTAATGTVPSQASLLHNISNAAQQAAREKGQTVEYRATPFGELIVSKDLTRRRRQLEWLYHITHTYGAHYDKDANVWHIEKLPDTYNPEDFAPLWDSK